jgi:hypothetical protein
MQLRPVQEIPDYSDHSFVSRDGRLRPFVRMISPGDGANISSQTAWRTIMTYEEFSAQNAALLLIDHQIGNRF